MTQYNWRVENNGMMAEFAFKNQKDRDEFSKLGDTAELVKAEKAEWYNNATIAWATAFLSLIAVWLIGVWRVTR